MAVDYLHIFHERSVRKLLLTVQESAGHPGTISFISFFAWQIMRIDMEQSSGRQLQCCSFI